MRKIGYALVGLLIVGVAQAAAPRPNIVYFYVDDMGWGAIGPNGQDARREAGLAYVKTPNIDSLVAAGVNFQRAYGCTVCSPARSTLMTGFHQGHAWCDRNDTDNAKKGIRADDITLGDALKSAGYATGYWGKWGFGGSDDADAPVIENLQSLPNEHGFDDVLAELHHMRAHTFFQPTLWSYKAGDGELALIPNELTDYLNNDDYPAMPANQNHADYPSPAYCDDYYLFRALDFVRENAQQYNNDGTPFFACISPQIPHSPFSDVSDLPEWDAYYSDDTLFDALTDEAKEWAAMVTRIDAHFGNILEALEDPNGDGDTSDSVAENTLVIFQSDNGGDNNDGRTELGSTEGLRGYKTQIWEGGIRVPMVMRWPAMITAESAFKAGTNSQKVIDTTDMLPTFCELSGVDAPLGIDGVSLASMLMGIDGGCEREFIVHEAQPDRSIIYGDLKLVDDGGTLKLYDLASDQEESTNIADENAELVTELATLMYGERVAEDQWDANTYHNWTGANGASLSDAANWSDYIYSNAVNQTVYQRDDGAPRVTWVATVENAGDSESAAVATDDVELLALELAGSSDEAVQSLTIADCTVTGRNEIRLSPYSNVELARGTLASLRRITLHENASIEGAGTIDAPLYQAGLLSVTGVDERVQSGTVTNSLIENGGFESGTGTDFTGTDEWFNAGNSQTASLRTAKNPNSGTYRAIVGNGSNGAISPSVDPGYTIASGDRFTLSFAFAAASNWDIGDDTMTWTLYYEEDGEHVLGSAVVTPTQHFADGYDTTGDQEILATSNSVGHSVLLRIESTTAGSEGEFGSIDDVALTVVTEQANLSASRECVVNGDYELADSAELNVTLADMSDYATVSVAGNATLSGALSVTVSETFAPEAGDRFEILTADSVSGEFDQADDLVTGSDSTLFAISYAEDSVSLTVTESESEWVQPTSGVSDGGSFSDTYPVSNLFNESVLSGTDTISADTANSGNGYASSNPPDGGYPVTITVDFSSAQNLIEFHLWNASGGGGAGPTNHGIKQFDLLFFSELGGTGTQLDSQLDLEAAPAPSTGDYAAESFPFTTVYGVQSVQIVIDSNQLEDDSWVGAREIGFESEATVTEPVSSDVSKIVVYLLGGQSNADGHGNPVELTGSLATYATPLTDVLFYHGNGGGYSTLPADEWIALQYGSGSKASNADYFGSELSFGHAMNEAVGAEQTKIAIIKHTLGATKLYSDWLPGGDATTAGDGSVYTEFQATVNAGLASLATLYPAAEIQIEGMLWHQGEGDVNNDQHEAYESNLIAFIADVRATYGNDLIFGIAQLSDNQGMDADKCDTVQLAQSNVAAKSAWNYLVTTDDLITDTPSNTIHFPADSLITIGTRFAEGVLAAPIEDVDGNGIDDSWELDYWSESGQDPAANPDDDSYTNEEEFLLDSSPVEASAFEALIECDSATTELSWVGSEDRRYLIDRSTNLVTWTTQESYIQGADGTNTWSLIDTDLPSAFYRIRVQR